MARSVNWESPKTPASQLGLSTVAADASRHGAADDAEERAAQTLNRQLKSDFDALNAKLRAGQERARLAGGKLPEGFDPIRGEKRLFRLGTMPPLSDGYPIVVPMLTMLSFKRNGKEGSADEKAWMDAYAKAVNGDALALRRMGEISEKGEYSGVVDVQRAFFWYYRAGLAGDAAARNRAVGLKGTHDIDPVTMTEPQLFRPGDWRVSMDNVGQGTTTYFLTFDPDGVVSGRVEEFGGTAMINRASAGNSEFQAYYQSLVENMIVEGRWAYDPKRLVLELDLMLSSPAVPGGQAQLSKVQLLGANEGLVLYGRDEALQSFTIWPSSRA